ncbi:MAG: hypothetical protein APF76_01740 [Desulfitibacter sp. BRH_c19]|nr:MAG: hypothetical protein APF76_01740 [Desulfitibacter sp. BRH_c19]
MLVEYLIVDGYNVINNWPILINLKNDNLEMARDKLVEMLQNYQGTQDINVIVVYDAYLSKAKMRNVSSQGKVQVVYTKAGETADTLIERMIGELPARSSITVVTNDWNEQRIIMGKGALRMTSRELLYRLAAAEEIVSEKTKNSDINVKSIEDRLQDQVKKKLEEWRRRQP